MLNTQQSIQPPASFDKIIFQFQKIFTKPSFKYFKYIILSLILCPYKKTITTAIKLAKATTCFWNFHKFLNQYVWSIYELAFVLIEVIIKTLNIKEPLIIEDVLTRISGRWSLENAFRDMKQHLGLGDYQCRVKKAVERFVNLVGTTLSLLTLWSHQEYGKNSPELWDAVSKN
ncbi:MAG: hypothetical protein AB1765_09590 [Candidatus Hydrogenedentota bacterium]